MNMDILSIWAYVWDVIDGGADSVISTLKNEIGLNTLSVATCYHSVDHLRVHRLENNFYSSQAAIYFQPDQSLYKNTRIEPPVSPLAEKTNPLRNISDGCERHGMKLSSWTVCLHNSTIGRNQPEVAQRDVFGNPCWHALCPANEDVREYMRAIVTDLTTNYNFATVELESCDYQGDAITMDTRRLASHPEKRIGSCLGYASVKVAANVRARRELILLLLQTVCNRSWQRVLSLEIRFRLGLTNFVIKSPKPVRISICVNLLSVRSLQRLNLFPKPRFHQWRWETGDIPVSTQKGYGRLPIGSRFCATHRQGSPLRRLCETPRH